MSKTEEAPGISGMPGASTVILTHLLDRAEEETSACSSLRR
jgi:hypothetical protein